MRSAVGPNSSQGALLGHPTSAMASRSKTIPWSEGCGSILTKNSSSTDSWDGLGKGGTGEAAPRSDKPEPFDKSSRGQSTSAPPCPPPVCSTNTELQQGRSVTSFVCVPSLGHPEHDQLTHLRCSKRPKGKRQTKYFSKRFKLRQKVGQSKVLLREQI